MGAILAIADRSLITQRRRTFLDGLGKNFLHRHHKGSERQGNVPIHGGNCFREFGNATLRTKLEQTRGKEWRRNRIYDLYCVSLKQPILSLTMEEIRFRGTKAWQRGWQDALLLHKQLLYGVILLPSE